MICLQATLIVLLSFFAPHMADPKYRYKVAKLMIENQQIIVFSQIIDYIPKSVIAAELKTNSTRISKLLVEPFDFTLNQLNIIAQRIEVPLEKVLELVILQKNNKDFQPNPYGKRKKMK
jgi:hypothetical protein